MLNVLQILTVIFVAVAFALSLAHALELPGKMRLDKKTYYAVQPIYYPGFTIGGVSEPVGIILTIILLFFTPFGGTGFWLTLAGFAGAAGGVLVRDASGQSILGGGSESQPIGSQIFLI